MSDFPALTDMGIKGFDEITHYSLQQDRKDRDTLKIIYKRNKKGSLLPHRKVFKFGRASKMIKDDNSPSGSIEVFDISPFLQKVVAELDSLVDKHVGDTDKVKFLLKRVNQLEEDVVYASKEIKSILKTLQD
jgi:hypothetical protein